MLGKPDMRGTGVIDKVRQTEGVTTDDFDFSTPRMFNDKNKNLDEIIRDPSKLLEKDNNYYGNNAKNFWKDQEKYGEPDFYTPSGGEDDQLLEMSRVSKQSKAFTLWGMSEGTSNLSNKGATNSYFPNDFDRYTRVDSERKPTQASYFFASTTDPKSTRPTSAALRKDAKNFLGAKNPILHPILNSNGTLGIKGSEFKKTDITDQTWRTYSTSASGRAVSSIYHPITKRASRVSNFMEKSTITNESLYTFMTTEQVEELNLERCSWLSNKVLRGIGEYCPYLTTLNFQHCTQIRDTTIRAITNGCCNISFINLGYVFFVFSNFHRMCYLITDEALTDIFNHCKDLKVLSVHSCDKITGSSFVGVKNTPKLEVLDVSYCANLADWSLQFVSEYCPQLVHLDMSGCNQIGDDGLCNIVQHCTVLETLRVMLCDQPTITSRSLAVLTKFATKLKVLELTGVKQLNDECVEGIARKGQNLEFLSLNGCTKITDTSINFIEEYCQNLKCIEVCSCRELTVQPLLDLIHSVKKLRRVVISECNISESELSILRSYTQRCTIYKHDIPAEQVQEFVCYQTKKPPVKKKKSATKKKAKK
jgi:F-box/leucine-rich repeat protein 2/20